MSEDTATFAHTFDLVLEVVPQLATDVFVLLLDGDSATLQAAKHKFRNVVIVLCLFHASENMRKRFGPLCRNYQSGNRNSTNSSAEAQPTRWIQCQNSDCNKWRQLAEGADYPTQFCCSDMTMNRAVITCDILQDEEFPDQYATNEDTNNEVMSVMNF